MPISATAIIDNSPALSFKYHILESLSNVTSNLNNNHVHLIKLKIMIEELTFVLEDN